MFEPDRALRTLNSHGVRYVVIGGYAAGILGSRIMTNDLDICYDRAPENLERLAAALRDLRVRLRVPGVDEELPFIMDARTLAAGDSFTFESDAGDLDVLGTPSGTGGFRDLVQAASTYDLGDGLLIQVCSLDDLIRMKEAAGRPKDQAYLHELAIAREVNGEQEESGRH